MSETSRRATTSTTAPGSFPAGRVPTGLALLEAARPNHPMRRAMLTGGAAAVVLAAGMAGAAGAPSAHPDAGLIQMDADLHRANADLEAFDAAYPEADLDPAMVPCYAVIEHIKLATARTLEGLRVKAMAVAWCNGATLDVLDPFAFNLSDDTPLDEQIIGGMVRDLLAMDGPALDGRAGA